jgi:hypothetical protein
MKFLVTAPQIASMVVCRLSCRSELGYPQQKVYSRDMPVGPMRCDMRNTPGSV